MPERDPILITGVGRRIGLHLARNFLARGIPVIGTYRRERQSLDELRSLGAELRVCDFDRPDSINELAEHIRDRYPALRGIIHNASDWMPDTHPLPCSTIMQRMMQVHVSAPYQLNMALAPLLRECRQTFADIVHVTDYVSSKGSKNHIAYAASKAAQDNLTLSFSAKFSPKIKVNSVAPALILFNENDDEVYRQKALSKSLLRREGGLDEFQHAVDYLMDSQYVTGRVLHLDGGRHLVQ